MAEGARLESVCAGNCTEGSNPSLSAKRKSSSQWGGLLFFVEKWFEPGRGFEFCQIRKIL